MRYHTSTKDRCSYQISCSWVKVKVAAYPPVNYIPFVEPIISIITPAFNAAPFIAKTINSVMLQTYQNWELLIILDIYCLPEFLVDYRLVPQSRSHNKVQAAASRWSILREREKLGLISSLLNFVAYTLSSLKLRV